MKIIILTVIMLFTFSVKIVHGGPFGLTMGASISDIDHNAKEYSPYTYEVRVPQPYPPFTFYSLYVPPRGGLCRIYASFQENDLNRLKIIFNDLKRKLDGRYGKANYAGERSAYWNDPMFKKWYDIFPNKNLTYDIGKIDLMIPGKMADDNSYHLSLTYYHTFERDKECQMPASAMDRRHLIDGNSL